ncbi:MAG: transglutaminase domain-containing protein, partial [Methylococcales bacterium]|nr:transglutaminase domain-containing protein [Methylococcales bacterium]
PKPLPWYLAGYALLALLYIARTFLVSKEKSWRSAAVRYEKGIRFDFLRAGFVVAAVILLAAWSMPTLTANAAVGDALGSTQGPWRNFQDTWTRLFSSLRSYGTATTDAYQDTLVLGGPRTVGTTLIMDVQVKEKLPYVYWQAIAYDTYEDGRWGAEEPGEPTLHFPDDGPIEVPFTRLRQPIDQVITNYIPNSSFLFGAPEVVESNRQMFVSSKTSTKDEELVSSLRSRFVLRQGDQYRVRSKVSNADVSSLRKAALAYPSWVTDRYLQLPETITDETIALADSLVGNIATPLDKAVTIRNYLRSNVVYNDQIAAPPDGVDPVHHVLFVSQEGYCNYYASSMAVMLRSQGVPSRVVSGYAQGEFDEETSTYRVHANNAHTWVEVYFPSYGWVQFEPTASIPVVERSEGGGGDFLDALDGEDGNESGASVPLSELEDDQSRLEDLIDDETAAANRGFSFQTFPVVQTVIAVVILALAGLTLLMANKFNERVEADVDRSYTRLGWWARWVGIVL